MLAIEIYKEKSGKEPFVIWKDKLDVQTQARIDARITRIAETGNLGDFHAVSKGIWELRLNFGSDYRIYFGRVRRNELLLLWGGSKSGQDRDIKKAKQYWQEYFQGES